MWGMRKIAERDPERLGPCCGKHLEAGSRVVMAQITGDGAFGMHFGVRAD